MYILIDNYDSFVHNLAAYLRELGGKVTVIRSDCFDIDVMDKLYCNNEIQGIIISPGPKRPEDSMDTMQIIWHFQNHIPILGVCLGHQIIAHYYGGIVKKNAIPMHGKISKVYHNDSLLFQNIPRCFNVTRYHSLSIDKDKLPDCLAIDAYSDDDVIMAIHHTSYPVYGIQFHPEAILTEYGHQILKNFMEICERRDHEYNN